MFHALTSENKHQNDASRAALEPEQTQKLSPPVPGTMGLLWPGAVTQQQVMSLHSLYGNQAVLRMMPPSTPAIQPKLTVNQPGDLYEQEADRVADQVMRMTGPPTIRRNCSSGAEEEKLHRKCAECEEQEKEKKKMNLGRKETHAGPRFAPISVHQVLNSPGQPLDPVTRSFMEPRFSHDFSHVRVHDDSRAADSAKAVNAHAYTVGRHIVFASGQYSPATLAGQRLLAHELVHAIQQTDRGDSNLALNNPDHGAGQAGALRSAQIPIRTRAAVGHAAPMVARQDGRDTGAGGAPSTSPADAGLPGGAPTPPEPAPDTSSPPPVTPEPEPEKKADQPPPKAKKAQAGTDSKGQDYVVHETEIRVGGTRTWRDNNPGNFDKAADHPTNTGNDANTRDARIAQRPILIFPDAATGMQELISSIQARGTSSIRTFITRHAPPEDGNDTEGYIRRVVSWMNNGFAIGQCKIQTPAKLVNDGTLIQDLGDSGQSGLATAMARQEGWCDVAIKKATYNCQSASIPDEYKGKLACP